jgi:hypothetical protein
MEEVIAAQAVMSQSLFEEPGIGLSSVDRIAEAQEEQRAELALLAERFEGWERHQARLLDSLAVDRRRSERRLHYFIAAAIILAVAAMAASLLQL